MKQATDDTNLEVKPRYNHIIERINEDFNDFVKYDNINESVHGLLFPAFYFF